MIEYAATYVLVLAASWLMIRRVMVANGQR